MSDELKRENLKENRVLVDLNQLEPWDKNPRSIKDADYNRLKRQIELGEYKPLLIMIVDPTQENPDPKAIILGGNMRYRIYKELGHKRVWVSIIEFVEDAPSKWLAYINGERVQRMFGSKEDGMLTYALSDNDRAGGWEEEALAEMVQNSKIELGDFKVDLGEPMSLADLMAKYGPDPEVKEDEFDETLPDVADSKEGVIYNLGKHRLLCGDSTKRDQVLMLMGDKLADMVFTDPPYGVDYTGKTKDSLTIKNDGNTETFAQVIHNFITKRGAAFYVCGPSGPNIFDFIRIFNDRCYLSTTIIWVKNSMVLGHGDYHCKHEHILYGWSADGPHLFYGDRKQTTIWEIDRPTSNKEHPTMKPVALCAKAITNSSKMDDIVLDLFGGSGTTLIACDQLNRVCYMAEIDPKYCDVIRKRYAKLMGHETDWVEFTASDLSGQRKELTGD